MNIVFRCLTSNPQFEFNGLMLNQFYVHIVQSSKWQFISSEQENKSRRLAAVC